MRFVCDAFVSLLALAWHIIHYHIVMDRYEYILYFYQIRSRCQFHTHTHTPDMLLPIVKQVPYYRRTTSLYTEYTFHLTKWKTIPLHSQTTIENNNKQKRKKTGDTAERARARERGGEIQRRQTTLR